MNRTAYFGVRGWMLAGLVATGLPALNAGAQIIPGEADHLKCYQVIKDEAVPAIKEVDLVNHFGLEPGCHLKVKARTYCTPVRKFIQGGNGNDPRGGALATDFTCYKVQCPPNPTRRLTIDDQFGQRDIGIRDARMLCTPTILINEVPND
jgi:hypothetical protein